MGITEELDRQGHARLPGLLDAATCAQLAALFAEPEESSSFRKTIEMERHAYGAGRYRYFDYPLPPAVQALREELYPRLLPTARSLRARLGEDDDLPASLSAMLRRCRDAGQRRPTPLLLRYVQDGYNRMHQDVYGTVSFPLQLTVLLSPTSAFEGGEFLVSESRARMQTRTEAIRLEQGEGIVVANTLRPVAGRRGPARAQMRHGVSRIRRGERYALGILFHDAE